MGRLPCPSSRWASISVTKSWTEVSSVVETVTEWVSILAALIDSISLIEPCALLPDANLVA